MLEHRQKDLVKWLRDQGQDSPAYSAADEIERLQAAWESAYRRARENGAAYHSLRHIEGVIKRGWDNDGLEPPNID